MSLRRTTGTDEQDVNFSIRATYFRMEAALPKQGA